MQLPTHRINVDRITERLRRHYGDQLGFETVLFGNRGWHIRAFRPGEQMGLVFHWDEIDNGAAGIKENALRQLNAWRDGTDWEPVRSGQMTYRDVMTIGTSDGVGELG